MMNNQCDWCVKTSAEIDSYEHQIETLTKENEAFKSRLSQYEQPVPEISFNTHECLLTDMFGDPISEIDALIPPPAPTVTVYTDAVTVSVVALMTSPPPPENLPLPPPAPPATVSICTVPPVENVTDPAPDHS